MGHFILILCYFVTVFLPDFGFEHHLYLYGSTPHIAYSDMTGFGPYTERFIWFALYWSLFALILTVLTYLLWPRGVALTGKLRWQELKRRFSRPVLSLLILLGITNVTVGGFIYYNTNILNKYVRSKDIEKQNILMNPDIKNLQISYSPCFRRSM